MTDIRALLSENEVPPVPADVPPGGIAWLRASVARFARGADHERRRALAVHRLPAPEPLRDNAFRATTAGLTGEVDLIQLARPIVIEVLAAALGVTVDPADVITAAANYQPQPDNP